MTGEFCAGPGEAGATRPAHHPECDKPIEQGRRIIDAAFARAMPLRIAAGKPVSGPDAAGDRVCRLSGGWAYRAVTWADGRRAILDIYLPGDILRLDAAVLDNWDDEVVAVTAIGVQAIDPPTLAGLMANPSAADAVFRLLAEQQRRIGRLAAALARRDAHERLALLLVSLYDRLSRRGLIGGASYPLPLTQQQIGDHLGLTLVHVNRVLRSLREKRIVSIDHHVVAIRDLDRLRQLAASGRAGRQPTVARSRCARKQAALDHKAPSQFAPF